MVIKDAGNKVYPPFQLFTKADQFLSEILDLTHDCLLLIDVKTQLIVYANQACQELYGYSQEELIGTPISRINITGDDNIVKEMQKVIKKYPNSYRFETIHSKKGRPVPVEVISKMIILNQRRYFLSHVTNIAKRKRLQNKIDSLIRDLSNQAYRDYLTGTYNRAFLYKVCLPRLTGQYVGLLMIDIDCFKRINDLYGHAGGDHMLVKMAGIIGTCLRSRDKIVRYGGDEFVIILPQVDSQAIQTIADRISNTVLATNFIFNQAKIGCSVSIGIASDYLFNDKQLEQLIKQADQNLLKMKTKH